MHQFQFSKLPGMRSKTSVLRQVRFAKLAALFSTTVTGASLLPWGWDVLCWAASHLPFLPPVLSLRCWMPCCIPTGLWEPSGWPIICFPTPS